MLKAFTMQKSHNFKLKSQSKWMQSVKKPCCTHFAIYTYKYKCGSQRNVKTALIIHLSVQGTLITYLVV